MAEVPPNSSAAMMRTALLVSGSPVEPLLCPFFANCDGVLVIDGSLGSRQFHRRDRNDATPICDLILQLGPTRLICGFIDDAAKERLSAAGIDVRLGSCSCSIAELVAGFHDLPRA